MASADSNVGPLDAAGLHPRSNPKASASTAPMSTNTIAHSARRFASSIVLFAAAASPAAAQLHVTNWTLVDPYNRWSTVNPVATLCRMEETASSSVVGPGWVVSPFTLPATASFSVTVRALPNGDDDFLGIAFSYQSSTQHLLLDWKRASQTYNWGDPVAVNDDLAEVGLKVKKIAGSFTRDGLWGGSDGLGVSTIAGPIAPGWAHNSVYVFDFDLTPGRVVIRRDGVQIFDVSDAAITAGAIAFYSFSQDNVEFSNVSIAPSGPYVYCTAGTSSNGCVPSIGASGTPNLAANSGYTIGASGIEGQKQGLFFYGVSGAAIAPWAPNSSSFLCVKTPTQRMSAQNSGGVAGQCNGVFAQDWLAFLSANPLSLGAPFVPGTPVNAQAWYRDPAAAKTTNLSNALEFVVVP